jgi:pimeloyl-ACP methyl ester carboxylesterase
MPFSTARGFKTHYVEEGHGPAVVFVHGFLFDHTMFAAQFEDLPERYRCIARDMRGHGRSECPDGPWSMQDLVVDLIRFIEDVDAAPCHLVGFSIGGMAAVRLALQREDLVRSLVMIDSTAGAEDPGVAEAYAAYQARVDREDGITEDFARETMGFFFSQSFMEANPELIDIQVDRETKAPTTGVVEGLRVLIDRDSVVDRLGDIRVPALAVHGEADLTIPMTSAEAFVAGVAGAELIRVPNAGHTTPLEAPDVVNEALNGFLGRVKR